MSEAKVDKPNSETINVFEVTQLARDTFLEGLMGADFIEIPPKSSSQPHRHNHSDNLIYVVSGCADLLLNDVPFPLSPGERVFVPRGMWHAFKTADATLRFISIQIPPILDKMNGVFDLETRESGISAPK